MTFRLSCYLEIWLSWCSWAMPGTAKGRGLNLGLPDGRMDISRSCEPEAAPPGAQAGQGCSGVCVCMCVFCVLSSEAAYDLSLLLTPPHQEQYTVKSPSLSLSLSLSLSSVSFSMPWCSRVGSGPVSMALCPCCPVACSDQSPPQPASQGGGTLRGLGHCLPRDHH